jgi:hypothetical protein
MSVLKQIGWYTYAVLITVLTLGVFLRFHLITVRKRTLGGVRAGTYGCVHVYREDLSNVSFVVVSGMVSKKRYPVSKVSYAETGVFKVRLSTSGSRRGGDRKINTWQTRTVATFINAQIGETK